MSDVTTTCGQLVTPADDCCGAADRCGEPATWAHPASGSMLCDLHEGNARQYSTDGRWALGALTVSYPDGWESIAPAAPAEAAPTLEVVRFDS